MKKPHLLLLATLGVATLHAAPLKKAEFTRVINDVKKIAEQAAPEVARIGDVVQGKTSVTTGAQSRAELTFEDKTITRLGANSVFSMEQGTRNVELKQGVLLMQVPKHLGGAKIRTAAVTAAVTGTTVMIEYMPDGYVKLIVLEGEMDVFRNDQPSVFSTLKAGDMIIMKPNAKTIPLPVQVDLLRLKRTSKLTNEQEFGLLGNKAELKSADATQIQRIKKGELTSTSLRVIGSVATIDLADTIRDLGGVNVRNASRPNGNPQGNPRNSNSGANKFGVPDLIGGTAIIDNSTLINTDPTIETSFSGTRGLGNGKLFRAGKDGSGIGEAAFGSATRTLPNDPTKAEGIIDSTTPDLDQRLREMKDIAVFKFENARMIGSPLIDSRGPHASKNLLLASDTDFILSDFDPFSDSSAGAGPLNLGNGELKNLIIAARSDINWEPTFFVNDASGVAGAPTGTNVILYTHVASPFTQGSDLQTIISDSEGQGNITMEGNATTPLVALANGDFEAHAANDLDLFVGEVSGTPTIVQAKNVNLSADRDIHLGSNMTIKAKDSMKITAQGSITVYDSTQLRRLSTLNPMELRMVAINGDVNLLGTQSRPVVIDASDARIQSQNGNITLTRADISASNYLQVTTLAPNGTLMIGGNTRLTATLGIDLYAEGANGMVRFVGPATLNGPTKIAGHTVQVDPGVSVTVSQPNSLRVYSDISNFNTNSTTNGNFVSNGTPLRFNSGGPGPVNKSFNSRHE